MPCPGAFVNWPAEIARWAFHDHIFSWSIWLVGEMQIMFRENISVNVFGCRFPGVAIGVAAAGLWAIPATARGQIFVADQGSGTIGEYATPGGVVNADLVSGLDFPYGIAVVVPEPAALALLAAGAAGLLSLRPRRRQVTVYRS